MSAIPRRRDTRGLARLASNRRVLLLSATPVRNRRAELAALLALFLGPRATRWTPPPSRNVSCGVRGDASLRPADRRPALASRARHPATTPA